MFFINNFALNYLQFMSNQKLKLHQQLKNHFVFAKRIKSHKINYQKFQLKKNRNSILQMK